MFLPLFALELRRSPRGPAHPRTGWAALAVALAGELVLVAGDWTRAARGAAVLGALGIARLQGRPGLRVLALLLWFVPVPHALVSIPSPEAEAAWAGVAAAPLRAVGLDARVGSTRYQARLHVEEATLPLVDADAGLPVAVALTGLAWLAGLRRGWRIGPTLLRAAGMALLAVPLQVGMIALVGALLALGLPSGAARPLLDVLPWATVVVAALAGPCHPRHRARSVARERLSSAAP